MHGTNYINIISVRTIHEMITPPLIIIIWASMIIIDVLLYYWCMLSSCHNAGVYTMLLSFTALLWTSFYSLLSLDSAVCILCLSQTISNRWLYVTLCLDFMAPVQSSPAQSSPVGCIIRYVVAFYLPWDTTTQCGYTSVEMCTYPLGLVRGHYLNIWICQACTQAFLMPSHVH